MPKTKTHSGAKKRFKVTGGGRLLRRHAMKSHLLEHKSPKRTRRFSKDDHVAAQADPPVVRVMDYGKYRYEQEQKAKLARKHQTQINVKEIKLRPKIGIHDYNTKKGHVERFLNQRAKVKVTIMFRGRENLHPERGRTLLQRLAEDVKELGVIESPPLLDGRNMVMVLGPSKNAGVTKDSDAKDTDAQRSEEAVQADGRGTAAAPARDEKPPARAQVAEAEAPVQ